MRSLVTIYLIIFAETLLAYVEPCDRSPGVVTFLESYFNLPVKTSPNQILQELPKQSFIQTTFSKAIWST